MDKTYRINIYIFTLFIIHTILAFIIKGDALGSIDFLNTSASLILGMLFGRLFLNSNLNTFETKRLLIIEKETDFLTKLSNRRKLYQDIELLDYTNNPSIGFMIIDIDNFKEYNDKYGHADGDKCLVVFSKFLLTLEEQSNVKFYRFVVRSLLEL